MNPPSDFQGSSRSELARWLELHGLDTKAFNRPLAKTLDMLLHECQQGETQLTLTESGKPLRIVSFVSVLIHDRKGRTLIESCQTLPNQVRRSRNLPLSEKLLLGEGWREAALRGIKEELGSILPRDAEVCIASVWLGAPAEPLAISSTWECTSADTSP